MYRHADQTWRAQPRSMTLATVRRAAHRIAEHARTHDLSDVCVVLHGGEPLLLGPDRLRTVLRTLSDTVCAATTLHLQLQTNGVLLSPAICDVLAEYGVAVGVSLDGDRTANDLHRRFADGRSSYGHVVRGLSLLRRAEYRRIYGGLLCTVDLAADPLRVYEALLAQAPPRVDLLLPHATWDSPPPGMPAAGTTQPYADWLGRVYDRWSDDGRPVPIRLFDSLLSTAAGGASSTEWLGLDPVDLIVVETDGHWEQVDSLKTSYHGAAHTGLNVFAHSVDDAARHPGVARRQAGITGLCATCRACPVVRRCGGGLLPHRYRSGSGFDNPSVYCTDLKELITRMDAKPIRSATVQEGAAEPQSPPQRVWEELARGYGSAGTIGMLTAAQLSMSRALVAAVHEQAMAERVDDTEITHTVATGWETLTAFDDRAPAATDRVVGHPFVRPWAIDCLRRKHPDGPAYLGNLAAATAIVAHEPTELTVLIRDGVVHLPSVGIVRLAGESEGLATISTSAAGFTVRTRRTRMSIELAGGEPAPGWTPTWRLDCPGLDVILDGSDPYRQALGPPSDHVSPGERQALQRLLRAAWAGIQRETPGYVASVARALKVLTPLRPDPSGRQRSGTSQHSYGAVGVGPVPDGDALAVLLIHEIQHAKFAAMVDLRDVVVPNDPTRVRVGWRPDPRPVEAALTGAYAHLAVADVWRARLGTGERSGSDPAERFIHYRDLVRRAMEVITRTSALTPHGRRFAETMRHVAES